MKEKIGIICLFAGFISTIFCVCSTLVFAVLEISMGVCWGAIISIYSAFICCLGFVLMN